MGLHQTSEGFCSNGFFAPSSVSLLSRHCSGPEENDETMSSEEREASLVHKLSERSTLSDTSVYSSHSWDRGQEDPLAPNSSSFCSSRPPHSLPLRYSQPTPFPSRASWLHQSMDSSWSGHPTSLPSCLTHKDHPTCSEESGPSRYKSLPGQHGTNTLSLEQPLSLHSNPPWAERCHHTLSPYCSPAQGPACAAQCPDACSRRPGANNQPWTEDGPPHRPYCKSAPCSPQTCCSHAESFTAALFFQIQEAVDFLQLDSHSCEFFNDSVGVLDKVDQGGQLKG